MHNYYLIRIEYPFSVLLYPAQDGIPAAAPLRLTTDLCTSLTNPKFKLNLSPLQSRMNKCINSKRLYLIPYFDEIHINAPYPIYCQFGLYRKMLITEDQNTSYFILMSDPILQDHEPA